METISEINIKGMVCNRCIHTIRELFKSSGYVISRIFLGKVVFEGPVDIKLKAQIRELLNNLGFELISDQKEKFLADIKSHIHAWTEQNVDGERSIKLSEYLVNEFSRNYKSISDFFIRYEGKTIEKYLIGIRIEKVKELLVYTDNSLSTIAFQTGFSSVHHLSTQFKKNTGLNPSQVREMRKMKTEEHKTI